MHDYSQSNYNNYMIYNRKLIIQMINRANIG